MPAKISLLVFRFEQLRIFELQRLKSKPNDADYKKLAIDFKNAMSELSKKYPNDLDASVLYAESIMNLNPWKLWTKDGKPAVGTEEIVDVEFVERDQTRHHARHLRVPGERAMLGARQRQSRLHFGKTNCGDGRRGGGERENRKRRIHATSANQSC